jgi:hypothetical protein
MCDTGLCKYWPTYQLISTMVCKGQMRRYINIPLPLPLPCKQDKSSSFLVLRSPQNLSKQLFWLAQYLPLDERENGWLTNERTNAAAFCLWKRRYSESRRSSGSGALPLDERNHVVCPSVRPSVREGLSSVG